MENKDENIAMLCASELTLQDLPDEIHLKIFANLKSKDLICCAQVSNKLRRICHDASLWQKINLCEKKVPSELLEQILGNGCQYLSLCDAQIKGRLNLTKKAYHLRYLNAGGLESQVDEFKDKKHNIEALLGSCHSVEKLSLKGLDLNTNIFSDLLMNSHQNLSVLDLSAISGMHLESIKHIVKCVKLTELNLCFIDILSKYADVLYYLVKHMPVDLRKLCLMGLDCLSDEHVKVLVNRCNKLIELDLFGCFLVSKTSVANIIEQLPELVKIDLSLTKISTNGLIELKSMPQLKFLNCQHLRSEIEIQNLKAQLPNIAINSNCGEFNTALPTNSIQTRDGFWDIEVKQVEMLSPRIWDYMSREYESSR